MRLRRPHLIPLLLIGLAWPAQAGVIPDTTPPRLVEIDVQSAVLKVELSEETDLASANSCILVDDHAVSWTLDADHYTLTSASPLSAGAHTGECGHGNWQEHRNKERSHDGNRHAKTMTGYERRFLVIGLTKISETWGDAPAIFHVQAHCEIEREGDPGGEAFEVHIVSPQRLAEELTSTEVEFARGHIFMLDYDEAAVTQKLQHLIDRSGARSWEDLKSFVDCYFQWI